MKTLSFEEWHKNKYQYEPQKDLYLYDMIDDVHEYAQYRAKLAWDEAAKAQRDACASYISQAFCNYAPMNGFFGSMKNAPLVEYKETL